MRSPVTPVLATLDELVRDAGGSLDEVWRLEAAGSELRVAALRVAPGVRVELPDDREVFVVVLDGRGHLRSADSDQELAAHTAIWLPRGREERLHAGEDRPVLPDGPAESVPPRGAARLGHRARRLRRW